MEVSAFRIVPRNQGKELLRLNLGCGLRHLNGFVNVDSNPEVKPDLVQDITQPFYLDDESCAEIQAHDVLEHLPGPEALFHVMNECHRLLVPDGTLVVRVPNVLSRQHPEWAWKDPTHRLFFCEATFEYFDVEGEEHLHNGRLYGIKPWRVQRPILRLHGDGILQVTLEPVKE